MLVTLPVLSTFVPALKTIVPLPAVTLTFHALAVVEVT